MKAKSDYSIQETADILRVSERTIYRWIHARKLRAWRLSHRWTIPAEAITDHIKRQTEEGLHQ